MALKDYATYKLESGPPILVDETSVIPQSRVLTVRWPGGGWVWNRPVAVLVEKNGQVSRLPILDITRMAQIGFLFFSFVIGIVTLLLRFARGTSR